MSYISTMSIVCEDKAYEEIMREVDLLLKNCGEEEPHREPLKNQIIKQFSEEYHYLEFDWRNHITSSPVYKKALELAEEIEPEEGYMIKMCVLNEDNSGDVYDNSDGNIEGCELCIDTPLGAEKVVFAKEYAACLIDIVEDFLEEKGIKIQNDEHEGDEGEAIIYGSDFDYLLEKFVGTIEDLCNNFSLAVDKENWS